MLADVALTPKSIRNASCTDCPLYEGAKTVCLMGSGPIPADLMIVGEAPGAQEDQAGLPFIGQAGQLLDRELAKVGINRKDVYVTNVNKCRPPGNRPPTVKEIKACRKYLEAEIEMVQPKFILLLGNSALQGVLSTSGILKKRGAAIIKNERTHFATFHPAAVLRNPTYFPDFRNDLKALKNLMDGKNDAPTTTIYTVRTEADLAVFFKALGRVPDTKPIAFDVETGSRDGRKDAGLEPWASDGRLDTVAFSWESGEAWVIALEHPEQEWEDLPGLYKRLHDALQGRRLGGHNIYFDLMWMRSRGVDFEGFFDTILMLHLLNENASSNSLKPLARTFLGAELYEDEIDYRKTNPLNVLSEYNGRDADYTLRLYHIFRAQLAKNKPLTKIYKLISMPADNLLADVSMRGFPVDTERLYTRHAEIEQKINEIHEQLMELVPEDMRDKANFRSPQFLGRWLFGTLGLPIVNVSERTGQPSTNEASLYELRNRHPAIKLLLDYRGYTKWHGTYTGNWIERIEQLGRPLLHPHYNLTGTVTGRLSSNMQQIPRDNYIRGIIGAPEGWRIVENDFSQVELRIAAMFANEQSMIDAYQRGEDLHLMTAMAVTGKPADQITKEDRTIGKSLNFGLIYGMGWRKYQATTSVKYGVELTDKEAQRYRKDFFTRYPSLTSWHDRQRTQVNIGAKVSSPLGRTRHLATVRSDDEGIKSMAERQGINSPVQSLASDMTLLAMIGIENALNPNLGYIFGQVHDSILILAREKYAEAASAIAKDIMENLPLEELFDFEPTIPIVADTSISIHLGGDK